MKTIREIIGEEEERELRREFNDLLSTETDYEEVEELLLSYGLEMDYLEQLLYV